jgi:signal transduction histidine kinase/DNA-binding response OmpR family regulator
MNLSIRFRYLLAVFLLAILATFSWLWLSKIINQQDQDAQVINLAGNQRMLSQRVALLSYRIDKASEIDVVNKQLKAAVTTFASNHNKLTNLKHIPDGAKSLYFGDVQLDQRSKTLINVVSSFINDSTSPENLLQQIAEMDIDRLLYDLNLVVSVFENDAKKRVSSLYQAETWLWALTLFLLTLEVLFIFEPMRRLIVRQISDLKLTAARAIEAEQKAVESNKVKAQFVANMSHELRTPMSGMFGLLDLALSRPNHAKDYIKRAKASGQQLLLIINDILDFEKIDAGKLELNESVFSLFELMDKTCTTTDILCRQKNISFVYEKPSSIPEYIKSDAGKIVQVLNNLMTNAITFTEKGSVTLTVGAAVQEKRLWLVFSVTDTGIGIETDKKQSIFEEFSQADSSISKKYGGTGLGLAISSRLTHLLNGKLEWQSEIGKGSRFTVSIPVQKASAPKKEIPHDTHCMTCAVVDDLASSRELMTSIAKDIGYETHVFENGKAFIDDTQCYDVLLLDFFMPEVNSANVIKHLMECNRLPKHIFLVTAEYENLDIMADVKAHIDAILEKSTVVETLKYHLRSVQKQAKANTSILHRPILVAEDNDINAHIIEAILVDNGHEVVITPDGQQAIDWLKNSTIPPGVILMDMQMPAMDGVTATRYIRQEMQLTIPIIGLTANALKSDHELCLDAGMDQILTKPIDKRALIAAIHRLASASHLGTAKLTR